MVTQRRVTGAQWRILALLVISNGINFVYRANLSIAAPQLRSELGLSQASIGVLLSAVFWTYTVLQPGTSWFVDRFNIAWVFGIAVLLWTGATFATGSVSAFGALLVCRLILGFSESLAYPSFSNILSNHFPKHRLALANGLIDAGGKIGPALGILLGGLMVQRLGWRAFFIALGAVGIVWLIPWVFWSPRSTTRLTKPAPRGASPSYLEIMRVRASWGTAIAQFGGNYFWFFLITWLPSYLIEERKLSLQRTAVLGALPFLVTAVSTISAGWLSDRLIQQGHSLSKVRLMFATLGEAGMVVVFLVPLMRTELMAMVVLCAASVCNGIWTSNLFAITQILAGPRAAGRWTGFQNGLSSLAGVVGPWLTGWLVDRTGEFYLAFVACACAVVIGASSYVFVVRHVEPVRWASERNESSVGNIG